MLKYCIQISFIKIVELQSMKRAPLRTSYHASAIFLVLLLQLVSTENIYDFTNTFRQTTLSNLESMLMDEDFNILELNGQLTSQVLSFEEMKAFQQSKTIQDYFLYSNMLVTSKYALVGQNNQVEPTLKKLDFSTMTLSTVKYPAVSDWTGRYPIILADLNNGDIAFGQETTLFIINNETLKLKQTFTKFESNDYIGPLLSYSNIKTQESKYIFGKGTNSFLMSQYSKDKEGKYESEYKFDTPSGSQWSMILTGTNSAVSLRTTFGTEVLYWKNLNSILYLSYDHKYLMKNRQRISVSSDESFFVVRNDSSFYQFYKLDEKYETTYKSSIFVNYNDHRKGRITSDDQALFLSMSNSKKQHNIAKVNINTSQFTLVLDENGSSDNQLDFNLFEAKSNRFVTLSLRDTNKYYLQLRSVDELQLIHELPIQFDFPILEYKLVGNIEWGLTFALATRTSPASSTLENDSKIYLYKVEGDKVISLNVIAPQATFATLEACHTYILSYKSRFPTVKVLHFSNLSQVAEINAFNNYENTLNIEKNILILSQYEINAVFDLKQSFTALGWFYKGYAGSSDPYYSQIFPKRGLLYEAAHNAKTSLDKIKKLYNISSPAVSTQLILPSETICKSPTYYIPPESSSPSCNFILFFEFSHPVYQRQPKLLRYSECTKAKDAYPIDAFLEEVVVRLFISTDKKYVIALVCQWSSNSCLIEVRTFQSLQKAIYHEFHEIDKSKYQYLSQIDVDLARNLLLIHGPSFIKTVQINIGSQFNAVDINQYLEKKVYQK